ncbi:MAG: hypothetical protein QOF58_6594, partial [Pseudonocardiales bacterium]|nr:hypothetical protein [Pseudonocardiales bacterium]
VLTVPVLSGPGPAGTKKPPKPTTAGSGSGSGGSGSGSSGSAGSVTGGGVLDGAVGSGTMVQGTRFSSAGAMASTGTDIAWYARIAGLGLGLALAGAGLVWWSRKQRNA